jgi:thiol-disulfide isomerase/thioredoxin
MGMTRTLAIFLAATIHTLANEVVTPGQRVPDLSGVRWIHGEPMHRFEPGRVYVLEFWSTWCGACAESIETTNQLARRYAKEATFLSIHIGQQESAPKPTEFLQRRLDAAKPIMEFSIADDIDGKTAMTWMNATECTGLPTAMIVDREGTLAWFGHARDVERPIKEVIEGRFDRSRNVQAMTARIRAGRLGTESDRAIEKGEYDEGIRLILEALASDPDSVVDWIPSTYGHLLATSRSLSLAAKFARTVLATDAGNRKELFAGLANAIFHFRPKDLRDLDLALTLARKAYEMGDDFAVPVLNMIVGIRCELGDSTGAIRELELALPKAPTEEARSDLARMLDELRGQQEE